MLSSKLQLTAASSRGFYVVCSSRKKKAASKESDQAARIVDTSQYSLKQQLRFVKAIKYRPRMTYSYEQANSESKGFGQPAPRSAFRRKRVKEEAGYTEEDRYRKRQPGSSEIEEEAREDALLGKGRGIRSIYRTKGMDKPPALLVDGYNCLLWWMCKPGEKARKDKVRGDLDGARLELLHDLSAFSSWRGVRTMVAWDALGNPDAPALARSVDNGVEVVFVGDMEADSFIIQEAQQLRASGCPHVLVASNDRDIVETCLTDEIYPISAEYLLKEINRAQREAKAWMDERNARIARSERLGAAIYRKNPALYEKMERARLNGLKDW